MKIVIKLNDSEYVKEAIFNHVGQLGIYHTTNIDYARMWDMRNAKLFVKEFKSNFPLSKIIKL